MIEIIGATSFANSLHSTGQAMRCSCSCGSGTRLQEEHMSITLTRLGAREQSAVDCPAVQLGVGQGRGGSAQQLLLVESNQLCASKLALRLLLQPAQGHPPALAPLQAAGSAVVASGCMLTL